MGGGLLARISAFYVLTVSDPAGLAEAFQPPPAICFSILLLTFAVPGDKFARIRHCGPCGAAPTALSGRFVA